MWHIGQIKLGVQNSTTVPLDCASSSLMADLTHWDCHWSLAGHMTNERKKVMCWHREKSV